ncbi:MAG TPA: hypothetical protein DCY40_06470, partial [Actinobacteria bacterium]|nr:hypothetical protein [Actinomycetota bacterium]
MVRRSLIVTLAAALIGTPIASQATTADTSATEQWLIYELNRARWNPWGYAEDHGVVPAQTDGPLLPRPPLAVNTDLAQSSGYKAQQTVDYPNLFNAVTHCTTAPGPKPCPDGLARYFGYPLPGTNDAVNTIESYWSSNGLGATPPDVAGFLASPQHIDVMFKWEDRREVGVGWADGCAVTPSVCADKGGMSYLFIHLGYRSAPQLFITGVVFTDSNGNGIMDLGEGKSGVTVTAGGSSDVSGLGGGYAIPVSPGSYTVTAAGSGFAFQSAAATVGAYNVGVDF